ncbi:MAG: cyclic nucleotide-binding domain-containing protein [Acetobacteraceae bacterium]|nr:cyclic nucleotide-binding domain-containing protein [Acetobacteraceae bacterium]
MTCETILAGSGRSRRRAGEVPPDLVLERAASCPLLAGLAPPARERLLGLASVRSWAKHGMILREGERPRNLYLLVDGLAQLCTMFERSQVTLLMLTPGACFAASALLRGEPMLAAAQALRASLVAEIPATPFLELVRAMDPLAQGLLQDFAIGYRNALREIKTMRLPNKRERLLSWVLTMQREAGAGNAIELPFTKVQLAARLGMQPSTLSRLFARLARHGVEVQGRFLRVRDIGALERLGAEEGLTEPPVP